MTVKVVQERMQQPVALHIFPVPYMNAVRRVLIGEIPVYIFNMVTVEERSGKTLQIYNIQYIVQRFQCIPFHQTVDPKLTYEIHIDNDSTTDWMPLLPRHIQAGESTLANFMDPLIFNNLPILYIPPGGGFHASLYMEQVKGTGYSKYCHAWYDDDNFYIESIGRTPDVELAFNTAIQYLQDECIKVRNDLLNQYPANTFKGRSVIKFTIDTAHSRSILNIIVDMAQQLSNDVIRTITRSDPEPNSYIVALQQPHLSIAEYKVFIDINLKFIKLKNSDPNKRYFGKVLRYTLRQHNITITEHPCIALFLFLNACNALHEELNRHKLDIAQAIEQE